MLRQRDDARDALLDSYRRLAEVFHHVLSEQSLDSLLERIADTLLELIPYDHLNVYEADEAQGLLIPVLSRDEWAEQILSASFPFGKGLTGWAVTHRKAVLANQAHRDPRVEVIPGTPLDPQSFISVPLIARGSLKGALNIYRNGEDAVFTEEEFELAQRFGDAAALALDNAETRARLEHQAKTDSLTGLFNHRYFHERLRAELTRSGRSHESLAVMMMDIDDFKRVNDVHGHAAGDHVLVTLADQLARAVRVSDVVCRVGGEEFAVIMPSSSAEEAIALARRLTARMENLEFAPAGRVTLSIGIAHSPEHAMNSRELVACADAAMMTAKSNGKNRFAVFADGQAEEERTVSRRHEVRTIAHLKMLQSLSGKLARLNDVREIGAAIVTELRTLIDYHNCRVYTVEGDEIVPIAFRGELADYEDETVAMLSGYKVGEGITGAAAKLGRSILVDDTNASEHAVQIPGTAPIDESMIATPLTFGSRVIGVIVISKLGTGQFDEDDVRLLEVLAGHASVSLENARLYEAQRREAENAKELLATATALLQFSRDLATADDLETVTARTVELAAKALDAPCASIWLDDVEGGPAAPVAFWGYEESAQRELRAIRVPVEVRDRFIGRTEPFLATSDDLDGMERADSRAAYAVAPLAVGTARRGCIAVTLRRGDEANVEARKMPLLAGIAHQAQLAITNASNFAGLERTFLSTVESLANALEANDESTSSHTRRIAETALEVATALGLDREALKRVELGALLHDIGKIGIPSKILCKPGPLTAEERSVVELHPQLGERIIAPIERLADVRPVVRHCHEHFDGRGYPDGRSGEEIPIESRIIFVCDAFHAMTSDRPYRPRLTAAEAKRRLREGAGTQFDPHVVAAYLQLSGDASVAD